MPDHSGDRGAAWMVLATHDHLHIKHERSYPLRPQELVARQIGMFCVLQLMSTEGRASAPNGGYRAGFTSDPITDSDRSARMRSSAGCTPATGTRTRPGACLPQRRHMTGTRRLR